MIHLEVAVAVPIYQTLTYCLPKAEAHHGVPDADRGKYIGRRALVALGSRMVTGYVVDAFVKGEEKPEFTIRPIVKFLDEYPLFHTNLTSFFRWVADYYQYPIGLVIKAALPGGLAPKSKRVLVLESKSVLAEKFLKKEMPGWLTELYQKGKIDHNKASSGLSSSDKKILEQLIAEQWVSEQVEVVKDGVREKQEACVRLVDKQFPLPDCQPEIFDNIEQYRNRVSRYLSKKIKVSEAKALVATFDVLSRGNTGYAALKEIKKNYSGAAKPLQTLEAGGVVAKGLL